jgi:hypothetical protein
MSVQIVSFLSQTCTGSCWQDYPFAVMLRQSPVIAALALKIEHMLRKQVHRDFDLQFAVGIVPGSAVCLRGLLTCTQVAAA